MLYEVLLVAYLIVALALIGFVLIQQGKGADMGASFGSGGSNTVFGSSGSGNFMTKTTATLATLFFILSLFLGNMSSHKGVEVDEWEEIEAPVQQTPATSIEDVPAVNNASEASDVPATSNNSDSDVPK